MKFIKARALRWAGIAGAACFAVGLAAAQPGPMHGHGGPGIESVLAEIKGKLNLNTAQQQQWDAIRAQGKAGFEAARAGHQTLHAAMQAELAKTEPDLAAVAAIADSTEAAARAGRIQVRNQWLQLYATFTVEQKAVVRSALTQRMEKMESFRERMRDRMQGKPAAAG